MTTFRAEKTSGDMGRESPRIAGPGKTGPMVKVPWTMPVWIVVVHTTAKAIPIRHTKPVSNATFGKFLMNASFWPLKGDTDYYRAETL